MTTKNSDRLFTPEVIGLAVAFVLGAVLTILDATIVNVAVPVLARDLHVSISTIQWVPTIYLLSLAAVIPVSGWATERYGAKRVWLTALALFVLGSLLCAAGQSIGQLLVARVVQGAGGGLVMPVGQAMLARAAGPHRMGRVMSVVGVPMLLAPIAGPVIGGALVDAASWRWIFLVNLPVGAIALAMSLRLLRASTGHRGARLDRRGFALLPPGPPAGLALSVYGLSDAAARGNIAGRPAAALLAGIALVAAYVVHARRTARPLLDVRLFADRNFGAASAANFFLGVALFAVMLLLPLYLQTVRGRTPLQTGLLLIPQGLGAALAMPVAGALTDRLGARRVVVSGIFVAAAGLALFTQLGASTSYVFFCVALLLVGAGLGATITPAMAAGFRDLDPSAMPQASSAIATVQRLAGSVGTALLAGVLQHQLRTQHSAATAFDRTFVVALLLTAVALIPALLLPGKLAVTPVAGAQSAREETDNVSPAQPHDRVGA